MNCIDGTAQEIQLVELFDNNGEKMVFELLSKMEFNNSVYYLITPFDADEATGKKPVVQGSNADVFVLQEVAVGNEKRLEPLTDLRLIQELFDLFRQNNSGKYRFQA